jgi:chaperonin GroEL (HSP60 family)
MGNIQAAKVRFIIKIIYNIINNDYLISLYLKAVADIIRTTLGPRSMLKMLLDPMGGIVMTNDGNCILREVDVSHPAAKSMIELSRAQDEEVGDGTTSVIVLSK